MDSVIFKKMSTFEAYESKQTGVYPIFGFAASDYCAKYGVEFSDIEDFYIFGAILDPYDINDDFFNLMLNIIMAGGNNVCMLVFDTNRLSSSDMQELKKLDGPRGFEELKDCYEDRIVFARP